MAPELSNFGAVGQLHYKITTTVYN